jgi:hypothetical protein
LNLPISNTSQSIDIPDRIEIGIIEYIKSKTYEKTVVGVGEIQPGVHTVQSLIVLGRIEGIDGAIFLEKI